MFFKCTKITDEFSNNPIVHQLISDTTGLTAATVHEYLQNNMPHLITCVTEDINVTEVIMGKINTNTNQLDPDNSPHLAYILNAIINGHYSKIKLRIKSTTCLMLQVATMAPTSSAYFDLRQHHLPSLAIYNTALKSDHLDILQDISKVIGITDTLAIENIKLGFNVEYTYDAMLTDRAKTNRAIHNYMIIHNHYELIANDCKHVTVIEVYSAILSGSIATLDQVIGSLEPQANVHLKHPFAFDAPNTSAITINQGNQLHLLEREMAYYCNSTKLYSHTLNYAIQSNDLDMVKYVMAMGYSNVTSSNMLTAINHCSNLDIIRLLLCYCKSLPCYYWLYLGINNYIHLKYDKIKLLVMDDVLTLASLQPKTKLDYEMETLHSKIITNSSSQTSASMSASVGFHYDRDCLFKVHLFFPNPNHLIISQVRAAVVCGKTDVLRDMYSKIKAKSKSSLESPVYSSFISALFLFGKLEQIKEVVGNDQALPPAQVICELICYMNIPLLCHLAKFSQVKNDKNIRLLILQLNNDTITRIFNDNSSQINTSSVNSSFESPTHANTNHDQVACPN
ncbi:Hypothetical protein MVR_LOCUS284 [uncultured virus]|nr:Hypothetical protein MVR_LOCUS284 [uncultured virus]